MARSFVADFEKRLLMFEEELKGLVLFLFKRKDENTTYEIGSYLSRHSTEFMKLKKYNRVKAWYRLRKTLENLEEEGILRKEISVENVKDLKFLNYRWIKLELLNHALNLLIYRITLD